MKNKPDISKLGNWLNSWIQPDGAIYGFHNHSVWGDNPYRYGDFSCGHSTFASPMLPALATALNKQFNQKGFDLLVKLINFQTKSFQKNGFYKHIGFQVGDTLKHGLIHNAVPNVSLSMTALLLKDRLPKNILRKIDKAVRKNLNACDLIYQKGPSDKMTGLLQSCCNQDYCRLWSRLLHMEAFCHYEWEEIVFNGLNFMIDRFHIPNIPDKSSHGTLRVINDKTILEPAEYYGLMIHPLILGYKKFNNKKFISAAKALANHVIKSSWIDNNRCRRFHRFYMNAGGKFIPVKEPMLIGGMGMTLSSIGALLNLTGEERYNSFLLDMDKTYSFYQTPGGCLIAGSGWTKECDIIPSTAWQSHDFFHMLNRHPLPAGFWEDFFRPFKATEIILSPNCYWIEDKDHWALKGYYSMADANIVGRKDSSKFYIEVAEWISGKKTIPDNFVIPDEPDFIRSDDSYYHISGRKEINITITDKRKYKAL